MTYQGSKTHKTSVMKQLTKSPVLTLDRPHQRRQHLFLFSACFGNQSSITVGATESGTAGCYLYLSPTLP